MKLEVATQLQLKGCIKNIVAVQASQTTEFAGTSWRDQVAGTRALQPETRPNGRSAGCRAALPGASNAASRGTRCTRRRTRVRADDRIPGLSQSRCAPDHSGQAGCVLVPNSRSFVAVPAAREKNGCSACQRLHSNRRPGPGPYQCACGPESAAPGAPCATCAAMKRSGDNAKRALYLLVFGTSWPAECEQSPAAHIPARPPVDPKLSPAACLHSAGSCY